MLNISHTKIIILISIILFNCNKIEKEKPISPLLLVPQRPIELVVTEVGESYIKLSWIDNSTNETGFKIEKRTDQSMYSTLASTEKNITSFIDSNLSWSVKYTYRVFSFNSVGFSSTHSNEVTATTLAPISPVVSNVESSVITFFSADLGGKVTFEGASFVSKRGFVYSKSPNPTTANATVTLNGSGIGGFNQKVVGLEPNTKYYVRAYATNNSATAYGPEFIFTTLARPESGIGSIGPGGGIVFYDKKSYSADPYIEKSWRYLEVSGIPIPTSIGSVNVQFAWGCSPSSSGAIFSGIGLGIRNQKAIEASCPSPFTKILTVNYYTWAAWVDSVNQKGFSDWYIPSLYEVQTIYNQLIIPGIISMGGTLASSTEHDPTTFKVITINGGPGPDNSFGWTPKFIGSSANQWLMIRAF